MTGYNPPKTVADRGLHIPIVPLEESMKREQRQSRREKIGNAALALGASAVFAVAAYHIDARFDKDPAVNTSPSPDMAENMRQNAEDVRAGQSLAEADMQQVQQINESMQKDN
ncbi:hypothetical protein KA047_00610 [Candidatus Saccharibacteria bacterium]|nr:hypothetical protein [Candidatus Saccharibacteria bacterium]